MGRHEDHWGDDEAGKWDDEWEHGDGLSGAAAGWRRPRNCPPPPPPPLATDQLHAPPPFLVGAAAGSEGGGITASTFVGYVAMGFGGTIALLAICICSFLVYRRVMQQRRERALADAAAQDPRRQQVENVQRMIDEKRQRAAAARKPFLVVHPGGDAVVAFKETAKRAEEAEEGYIKSFRLTATAGPAAGIEAAAAAAAGGGSARGPISSSGGGSLGAMHSQQEALMSRRALVAAAALSGRTTSGISDVVGDLSASNTPTAAGAELAMAAWGGSHRPASRQQQAAPQPPQQQQQQPGLQGHPSAQSLSSQGSQRPLLGSLPGVLTSLASEPPPAYQRADNNV